MNFNEIIRRVDNNVREKKKKASILMHFFSTLEINSN